MAQAFKRVKKATQGRLVDALVEMTEEGRGRLRYASGRSQTSVDPGISEWRNPTLYVLPATEYIGSEEGTC